MLQVWSEALRQLGQSTPHMVHLSLKLPLPTYFSSDFFLTIFSKVLSKTADDCCKVKMLDH